MLNAIKSFKCSTILNDRWSISCIYGNLICRIHTNCVYMFHARFIAGNEYLAHHFLLTSIPLIISSIQNMTFILIVLSQTFLALWQHFRSVACLPVVIYSVADTQTFSKSVIKFIVWAHMQQVVRSVMTHNQFKRKLLGDMWGQPQQ